MTTLPETVLSLTDCRSLHNAAGYLVDWDGCCAFDNVLVPGAIRFLAHVQDRAAIISNNSSNTVGDFLEILRKSGIAMRPEQIVLAGMEALRRAVELRSRTALVLSAPKMRGVARKLGLTLVREEPDIVVLLRDTRFSYPRLERAVNALRNGARLIVANPDLTHPGRDGRVRPETGALLAALGACIDLTSIDIEIVGKPSPRLFEKGCAAIRAAPETVVMLGDNPSTDLAGARALGIEAILVSPQPSGFFDNLTTALKSA